jgi:hypothetical protein
VSFRDLAVADKDMIIGRVINAVGMIGVSSGVLLFTFALVLLLFRRGFGFDIPNPFHWFW